MSNIQGPRSDLIEQNNSDARHQDEVGFLRYQLRESEEQYAAEAKHSIKLEQALLAFIHAYANVERLDHDHVEIKLFEAWLKGCGALGIQPDPAVERRS